MYSITLTIGNKTLVMNHSTGYDISTITGLTGVSSRLDTVQSNIGLGEAYTGGTVQGVQITVRGKILDGQTDKKQALLDTVLPLGEGKLTLYNINDGYTERLEAYRGIDVVVSSTPTITQEYHSKFSFTLYAPKPVWRELHTQTITVQGTSGQSETATVTGNTEADFRLEITPAANLETFMFAVDYGTAKQRHVYIDFRKLSPAYAPANNKVTLQRVNGKLTLTMADSTNAIKCLNSQSTLFALPTGQHSFVIYSSPSNVSVKAQAIYYPSYVGVALSGI